MCKFPDSASTKELHGKSYKISKFDNDNFRFDFKKNGSSRNVLKILNTETVKFEGYDTLKPTISA